MPAKKVMVVHSDPGFSDQVRSALGAQAPSVELFTAPAAARAMAMIPSLQPDLFVIEAELDNVDGYMLTQQLRQDQYASAKPVIIVALEQNESSALRARQVGASAQLPAGGPIAQLVTKIIELLGGPAAIAQAAGTPGAAQPAAAPAQPAQQPVSAAAAAPATAPQPVPARPVPAAVGAPVPAAVGAPGAVGAPASAPQAPPGYGTMAPPPAQPAAGTPGMPVGLIGGSGVAVKTVADGEVPHIDDLLRLMLERGGSDLHITVGSPPGIRLRGELVPVENMKPLSPRDTMEMILSLLSEEQRRRFETELELDFAYSIPGVSRFRANVMQQRNSMGAVFRVIPIKIPTMEELGLPKVCRYLSERPRGLVLVTGPTGSGKSTTLAAMVDHINSTRPLHIITLEDPIEFMHRNKKSYVNQREIGEDTHSFAAALKRVLRQDPDVILVGEMRDLETIAAAITAAETGHLVFATLHTTGGPETIDRIIDVFPPHQQQQVRMQLSNTLEGVLSQTLLRSTDGRSRVMAMEIMLGIPAISNLIREGKTHQMATIIQGGASLGMQTLDQHLKTLVQAGRITFDEGISKAKTPRELAQMLGRKI